MKKVVKNNSPWLKQLNKTKIKKLTKNFETEIAILGGGIAGITTAYYVLKNTQNKVVLVEGYKIAHGATGHNAGQIVSYFEKPFFKIVEEYGLDLAAKAQRDILHTWELIEGIYEETGISTPYYQFVGYAGCTNLDQIKLHLENKYLRNKAGINMESIFIAENAYCLNEIPKKYDGLYYVVPHHKIISMLETHDQSYIAAFASKKGCINSALFSQELVKFMQKEYSGRFSLYEHTPVDQIILEKESVILKTRKYKIKAGKIVLCTNGFENLNIINHDGKDIDHKFHEIVSGVIGYMSGYFQNEEKEPTAISYFPTKGADFHEPYFYLTRRFYKHKNAEKVLTCVGGPEIELEEKNRYNKNHKFSDDAKKQIHDFLSKTYDKKKIKLDFAWHGLMGYTKTGLRLIGPEILNENLLYNLGCNGVGILPSIHGAYKISQILLGKKQEESIFDPRPQKCLIDIKEI